ncbi:MAG: SIS domain-containing protein [Calditrichaeota bacterium]|nr:SIS domain-containing protein [Calditrichota bacterium]
MSLDKAAHVRSYFDRLKAVLDSVRIEDVVTCMDVLEEAYQRDATVYICGNGGSWTTATHWVCDFTKGATVPGKRRFRMLAPGDNMAMLTAYANDVSYASVFAEPLRAYARAKDVAILITASGNSPNILEAAAAAKELAVTTIGLIGFGGGKLAGMVDHSVIVESREYGPVEDLHLVLDHIISTYLKERIAR